MRIHHVGIVVPSIENAINEYTDGLGLVQQTEVVYDPHQDCHLVLLGDGFASAELIEPASPDSPAARQADNGGGYAHVCYETSDLGAEIERLRKRGALLVTEPTPAVLFGGRRVAFIYLSSRQLIELVEAVGGGGSE